MAEIVSSLFGLSPRDEYLKQQQAKDQAFATNLSNIGQTQGQKLGLLIGANIGGALGRGAANLFGIEDPQLAKITKVEGILQSVNSSLTPEERANPANVYSRLAEQFAQHPELQQEALMAQQQGSALANEYDFKQAQISEKVASAAKSRQEILSKSQNDARELKAQDAIQLVWKNATDNNTTPTTEQIIGAVAPYMPADKLATLIQGSADKEAMRNLMLQQTQIAAEGRIDAAKERGATALQIEKMREEAKKEQINLEARLKAIVSTNKPLTGREARYADNVAIAGNEAIGGINNIINLPSNVTGGFWGSGLPKMQAGTGLFDAPVGALKNNMTAESIQRYNSEIKNIGKYFSTLRNGGLAATNDDMQSFEQQFAITAGDKPLTALTKLAQMRQTFERVAEIKVNSKNTPPEQQSLWQDWLAQVKQAIPITVNDVNKIANSRDGNKTFKQVLGTTATKAATTSTTKSADDALIDKYLKPKSTQGTK